MKTYSDEAIAALAAGNVMTSGAVKIDLVDAFNVWGGAGTIQLTDGGDPEDYIGIGQAGLVSVTGQQLGGTEDGIELRLSGVDASIVPIVEAAEIRGARVTIWRLMFDGSGTTLLDAIVFERGRVDKLTTEETPGGTATIIVQVETAARGLGRNTGRMRSDADQRAVDASDGIYSRVTAAGELTLAWGGKPPARAGLALPNTSGIPPWGPNGLDVMGIHLS